MFSPAARGRGSLLPPLAARGRGCLSLPLAAGAILPTSEFIRRRFTEGGVGAFPFALSSPLAYNNATEKEMNYEILAG